MLFIFLFSITFVKGMKASLNIIMFMLNPAIGPLCSNIPIIETISSLKQGVRATLICLPLGRICADVLYRTCIYELHIRR